MHFHRNEAQRQWLGFFLCRAPLFMVATMRLAVYIPLEPSRN